jgi:hypothetical protein
MATEKQEPTKKSLQQQLDAITFKNAQAQKIKAMQEDKQKLKDNLGRNKKRYESSAGRVQGLQAPQGLRNTLGTQFTKPTK